MSEVKEITGSICNVLRNLVEMFIQIFTFKIL